jgi:hypothetical protein
LNVAINNQQVLTSFNILTAAKGPFAAYDKVFANIPAANGQIVIQFTGTGLPINSDINAKISAVAVDPQWTGNISNLGGFQSAGASPTINEFQNFFGQLTALGQQGFANLKVPAPRLRLTENTMTGLSFQAVFVLGDDAIQNGKLSSLMMSGNRLDSHFSVRTGQLRILFAATAIIVSVAECVVSGNLILNNTQNSDFTTSLFLSDGHIPLPRIAVTGNVLRGMPFVDPPRYPAGSNVPPPMDSWNFLNTTLP